VTTSVDAVNEIDRKDGKTVPTKVLRDKTTSDQTVTKTAAEKHTPMMLQRV
jgi:hypothetical protein